MTYYYGPPAPRKGLSKGDVIALVAGLVVMVILAILVLVALVPTSSPVADTGRSYQVGYSQVGPSWATDLYKMAGDSPAQSCRFGTQTWIQAYYRDGIPSWMSPSSIEQGCVDYLTGR